MFKRILVAIDGSPTADKAFDYALTIAKARNAHVHVLYVVDIPVAYVADADPFPFIEAMRLQGKAIRESATQRLKGAGVDGDVEIRELLPLGGDVAHQINVSADEDQADVIVIGTHGRRGFRRMALGSVAENCARQAQRPVILIPPTEAEAGKDVL
ncbi:Putative universal stress protein [Pandoraea eparura]|jgi:nucleotide-binding universal stress UspA family protein|uniref:Universal stress protein n=1 Tax=Pandoraea eparura TaxID=2508291 RepID=A0A5E4XHA6_9BURK|nr:universal stress protein [Pandoraea eparura]VVE35809.1 Putative universal stress protein [Pandoraea eparura]